LTSLYLSLLAFQPAANAIESILFIARHFQDGPLTGAVGACKSGKIIAWNAAPFWISDRADLGHHRYYGMSAYP
jgi:hypothetical protein